MGNAKKITVTTISNVFVLIITFIFMLFTWNNNVSNDWTKYSSIYAICLLIYQLIILKKSRISFWDFILWFVILQYLFVFGRVFLNALNLDKEIFWNLMEYYDKESLYRASTYALVFIQAIFTGMTLNIASEKKPFKRTRSLSNECLLFIGIVMLLISIPFRISSDLQTIHAQITSGGYVSLAVDNAFFYALGLLLPVALIYIICSEKLNKWQLVLLMIVYVVYSGVIIIFSGDRRYTVTAFIAIVLCFMKKNNIKISLKKIVMYGILVFMALFALAAIRTGRLHVISDFSDFADLVYILFTTSNIFYETLAEFGITFFIYVAVIRYFPSQFAFKYGATYLYAPMTIIPMSGFFFPGIQEKVSAHIDCKSITGQALGAALGEELYGNFGFLAPFGAIIVGLMLKKIFSLREDSNNYDIAKYYSLFYILINYVRASSTEVFRLAIYALIIPWFISKIYELRREDK